MTCEITIVVGPTASGKSSWAFHQAHAVGGIIINGDSQQMYAGLPILSAQPDEVAKASIPHHLYGHISPERLMSVPQWCAQVIPLLHLCAQGGQHPLMVGGTGFYIKALLEGLSPIPPISAEVSQDAQQRIQTEGLEGLRAQLAEADPLLYAHLKPHDRYRITRAWCVWKATGKPLSYFQSLPKEPFLPPHWHPKIMFINPPRDQLYARINARFHVMWEMGALDEVQALLARHEPPHSPLWRALGAKEIAAYLQGRLTQEEALEKACQLTRNYAKRQVTWFTHQLPEALVITGDS